jgi:hypothetical protein
MKKLTVIAVAAAVVVVLLVLVLAVSGQEGAVKPHAEGQAGTGGQFVAPPPAERPWAEGEAGLAPDEAPTGLGLLYTFSGVTDDGQQGSVNRKEATVLHCTNLASAVTTIELRLFNYDGTQVALATLDAPVNYSFTFSTQQTTIFFDDIVLGAGGTPAINQGSGQVWTDRADVICTAQVLDPLGYPPAFVSALELFRR